MSRFFPEPMPLVIETRPKAPPTLDFDGDDDIDLVLNDLGLEFYAQLDEVGGRCVSCRCAERSFDELADPALVSVQVGGNGLALLGGDLSKGTPGDCVRPAQQFFASLGRRDHFPIHRSSNAPSPRTSSGARR